MQQHGQDYWVPTNMELSGYRQATHRDSCNLLYEIDDEETDAVDLRGYGLLGLIVPTVEQASNLQFSVSDTEAGTYVPLCNADGTTYTITLPGAVAAIATMDLGGLAAYRWVKVVMTVKQTANREFLWMLKG